jgi:membrane associated rhomboid family serine protease
MFLDPGEASAVFGEAAEPSSWKEELHAKPLGPSRLTCPTGHSPLDAFAVTLGKDRVEIDTCPRCRGLWIDKNEGTKLYNLVSGGREEARRMELGIDRPGLGLYVFQLLTGFPMEVWNPVRRRPVIVHSLVALLIALFVFQLVLAGVLGSELEPSLKYFLAVPSEILSGRYIWTIVTCGFFHGGIAHILGNLYFLWIFGDNVEDVLGRERFLVLYGVSLVAASLLHIAFNASSTIPMLGASGAISGLMGAYLVLFPKVRLWIVLFFIRFPIRVIWYLGFWIAYQLVMAMAGVQAVAWFAHIGGFIAGLVMAIVFRPSAAIAR